MLWFRRPCPAPITCLSAGRAHDGFFTVHNSTQTPRRIIGATNERSPRPPACALFLPLCAPHRRSDSSVSHLRTRAGAACVLHGEPERDSDLLGSDDGAADVPGLESLGGRARTATSRGEPSQGAEPSGVRAEGADDSGARAAGIEVRTEQMITRVAVGGGTPSGGFRISPSCIAVLMLVLLRLSRRDSHR